MSENVIILGAGFSKNAGIPLLGQFAQAMWDVSARKSYQGKKLNDEDVAIFDAAAKIRTQLDGYHGRANFNERNIEDVLSILSFNVLAGDEGAKQQLSAVNRAIARTIELACNVTHTGIPDRTQNYSDKSKECPPVYLAFWKHLFAWAAQGHELPSILTFNYDLVLERALCHLLMSTALKDNPGLITKRNLRLNYHYSNVPTQFYDIQRAHYGQYSTPENAGLILRQTESNSSDSEQLVEILKLHGSVNFPLDAITDRTTYNLVGALDNPNILPPVFNKLSGSFHSEIWKIGLKRLRAARNIVIVGYSLPQTDIYMQYFLKAGLGPNLNFNKLTVYDPALFDNSETGKKMTDRYANCFAPQLQSRIIFQPETSLRNPSGENRGTLVDFVKTLENNPSLVLF